MTLNNGSKGNLDDKLAEIFHNLHRHPELSFKEEKTSSFIAGYLRNLGYEVTEGIARTGVIGTLKGKKAGPVVALRADMDALPVTEETGLPYRSENKGVMHACGHDVHITCALGAAGILAKKKDDMNGTAVLIFQPAEEINLGAKEVAASGIFEKEHIDLIFGLHNQPEVPAGKIAIKEGPLMAAVDRIEITVTGKGGHGGIPHRNIDPVVATGSVITGLQSIVSRNVNPLEAAVISIGTLHGGTANNVIPDSVEMTGTVRTFTPEVRAMMEPKIKQIVENCAAAFGCKGKAKYIYELPAVINPPLPTGIVRSAASKIVGDENIVEPTPTTGGEDFAVFQEKVPGCFFWLGVGNPDKGAVHPWHSPQFTIDEKALAIGTEVMAETVLEALRRLS